MRAVTCSGRAPAQIAEAIQRAARGETVLAPAVAARLADRMRAPMGTPELTAREIEVLALVAQGQSNAEVGRSLFIGEATVKTHLVRVFAKLGVSDRTAVRWHTGWACCRRADPETVGTIGFRSALNLGCRLSVGPRSVNDDDRLVDLLAEGWEGRAQGK